VWGDQSLESEQSWNVLTGDQMSMVLRGSLGEFGAGQSLIDEASQRFRQQLEQDGRDPIDAFVHAVASLTDSVDRLTQMAEKDPISAAASIDPSASDYADIESLPKPIRMTVRTWLGRLLVRARLYDEALPVIAEVDVTESIDPASSLFYRGACYHALLMKKEALSDLRILLENEDDCPVRFTRLAKLMIADIKPLKEDSLDEISRLMTDVSRRLDLGRSGEKVEGQEQKIIDKLTKLIDKLEEQQQQQQQQQQAGGGAGGGSDGQQDNPMQDSQIAGGNGDGSVPKKKLNDDDRWGNLPPAERKEALQKISRDLPTHYRDAIEAYFRKRATDG
jgi:tetratricopeptide (TPR) repeat protein